MPVKKIKVYSIWAVPILKLGVLALAISVARHIAGYDHSFSVFFPSLFGFGIGIFFLVRTIMMIVAWAMEKH